MPGAAFDIQKARLPTIFRRNLFLTMLTEVSAWLRGCCRIRKNFLACCGFGLILKPNTSSPPVTRSPKLFLKSYFGRAWYSVWVSNAVLSKSKFNRTAIKIPKKVLNSYYETYDILKNRHEFLRKHQKVTWWIDYLVNRKIPNHQPSNAKTRMHWVL